jgi:hypothetical protein
MASQGQNAWQDLCRAASTEKDSEKLLHLVSQINSLLSDEKKRDVKKPAIGEHNPLPKASNA